MYKIVYLDKYILREYTLKADKEYSLMILFFRVSILKFRIRELREDNDLTQSNIADKLNIHQTTYSDYELGNLNIPAVVLNQLADFYNTSIDYLVGRTDEKKPYPKAK